MKAYSINRIALCCATCLNRSLNKEGSDFQKMVLGLEILLHNLPKMILLIGVALMLNMLPLAIVTWLPFAVMRTFAAGLHAKNSINCTVSTLFMFIVAPYFAYGFYLNIFSLLLVFAVVMLVLYKYAPADTAARPILGKIKRARLKKKSLISCALILAFALIFLNETFYVLIALGAIYTAVVVSPITYKILKRRMNNYEQYE